MEFIIDMPTKELGVEVKSEGIEIFDTETMIPVKAEEIPALIIALMEAMLRFKNEALLDVLQRMQG